MNQKQVYIIAGVACFILLVLAILLGVSRATLNDINQQLIIVTDEKTQLEDELDRTQRELGAKVRQIQALRGMIKDIQGVGSDSP
jgi:peptidoglycan hydrolase CwlO-like protein